MFGVYIFFVFTLIFSTFCNSMEKQQYDETSIMQELQDPLTAPNSLQFTSLLSVLLKNIDKYPFKYDESINNTLSIPHHLVDLLNDVFALNMSPNPLYDIIKSAQFTQEFKLDYIRYILKNFPEKVLGYLTPQNPQHSPLLQAVINNDSVMVDLLLHFFPINIIHKISTLQNKSKTLTELKNKNCINKKLLNRINRDLSYYYRIHLQLDKITNDRSIKDATIALGYAFFYGNMTLIKSLKKYLDPLDISQQEIFKNLLTFALQINNRSIINFAQKQIELETKTPNII